MALLGHWLQNYLQEMNQWCLFILYDKTVRKCKNFLKNLLTYFGNDDIVCYVNNSKNTYVNLILIA